MDKKQTWVGYISQKIYIPEYIRFEDIFTGYNIIVKNRIYDRDILGLITKYILYPFFRLFCSFLYIWKKIFELELPKKSFFGGKWLLGKNMYMYQKIQYF